MEKITRIDALKLAVRVLETESYNDEAAVLTKMIEQIAKHNATPAERKPSKTQIANQGLKGQILEAMMSGVGYTISDMVAQFECCAGLSSQKVSAVVRQLKMDGSVQREDVKGKAYFSKVEG